MNSTHSLVVYNRFEEYLRALVTDNAVPTKIYKALEYMLFPGGKRLRPLFVLSLPHALGFELDEALPAAASVEILHAASLIHDDLPCLDNDHLRRGRPSCHIAFGEATALLAGDFMISWALGLVGNLSLQPGVFSQIIRILSRSSCSVAVGQQLEIEAELSDRVLQREIMKLKTGALFSASLEVGALCSGCHPRTQKLAAQLGLDFGVVFQIKDDIDDAVVPVADGVSLHEALGQMETTFTSLHEAIGIPLELLRSLLVI